MAFWNTVCQKLHMTEWKQRRAERIWLRKLLRKYRSSMILLSLLSIPGIVLGLAGNVVSKFLIDSITAFDRAAAIRYGAAYALLLPLSLIMGNLASDVGAKMRIRARNRLQKEYFGCILRAYLESLETYRSGELLNLLNADVGSVSGASVSYVPSLINKALQLLGTLAVMVYFDPMMAAICLVGIPILLLLSAGVNRKLRSFDLLLKEKNGEVMSFQTDSFQNLTSIKAFALTDHFTGELDKLQDSFADTYLHSNSYQLALHMGMSLAGFALTGICVCYGVTQLWQGNITYGSLMLLIQLALSLRSSCSGLLTQLRQGISLTNSAARLMALESLPEEDTRLPEDICCENITVSLQQASFSYHNGSELLHPFDFYAAPGDLIAVTGPSGEGKTTLLRLLLGMVESKSGKACITDGKGNVFPLNAGTRQLFSYVPQGRSIFAGTVAQNLRILNPEATDAQLWDALRLSCAEDFVRQLPLQLEQPLGEGGQGLSEGQAQRIAIARSLLRPAPVLLLDEATSALDPQTERQLLENLRRDGNKRTCIFVTHRQSGTEFCSRTYEIGKGEVREVTYGA